MFAIKKSSPFPRGFTLIEAVMTGAIIAVLATAAVIMWGGYVRESRRQAVENLAESAAAAANAYVRRMGSADGLDSSKLQLYIPDAACYNITINQDTITVTDTRYNISVSRHY